MKLFLLYETGGDYEDSYVEIKGVFSSRELAEKQKFAIELQYMEWLSAPDPFPNFKYNTDSEFKAHEEWYIKNGKAKDFSYCFIEEVCLDEPII